MIDPRGGGYGQNERTYLEVKLLDTLKAGKKYDVSFYISLIDSAELGSNHLQCYFSKSKIQYTSDTPLCLCSYIPQISCDSVIMDTMHWTDIKGSFTSMGGEHYLTIGNFLPDSLTKIDSNLSGKMSGGSAYYIDDVSVMEDTLTGINEVRNENSKITVYPNPSSGRLIFTMQGSSNKPQIEIYNMLGQSIYQNRLTPSSTELNLSNEPAGIYLYRIVSEKGECIGSGKLNIKN